MTVSPCPVPLPSARLSGRLPLYFAACYLTRQDTWPRIRAVRPTTSPTEQAAPAFEDLCEALRTDGRAGGFEELEARHVVAARIRGAIASVIRSAFRAGVAVGSIIGDRVL